MHGRNNHNPQRKAAKLTSAPDLRTASLPAFLTAQADGVTLAIKLQPRASKNEITDINGPELRIKVTAPPVDAAANEALLHLLAARLDCARGKVELIRGHTARHKVVKVYDLTATAVLAKLIAAAG